MEGDTAVITLMYHGISTEDSQVPPGREAGAELYDVPLEDFRQQMQWLKESGKHATLTFDDGEMNNYALALPILKESNLQAYFFIIINMIGREGFMGLAEINALIEAGMTVGSHGTSHRILTKLKDNQIIEELRMSKSYLERHLGTRIYAFSVPRGFCSDKIINMAYDAGYTQIFISDPAGLRANAIPRAAVKHNWTFERFQQAVDGKVPAKEAMAHALKTKAKLVLRGGGYDVFRKTLITLWK
jgi:peptidoglycan/xylan/chitin deacetylase (PgdA/CDA1 family)